MFLAVIIRLKRGTAGIRHFPQRRSMGSRAILFIRIRLQPGQPTDTLVLHLYPAGVISRQVLDEDEGPLPGLEVFALRVSFVKGGQRQIFAAAQAVTDDLGVAILSPGSHRVKAGGLINPPIEAGGLKEGPAGRVQYRSTFCPGTPMLTVAQAVHVGPMAEAGDTRFTVPAQKTFTLHGKALPGRGPQPTGLKEVACTSPDDMGHNFSNGRNRTPSKRTVLSRFRDCRPAITR
jgi:hypothetical protein